MRITTWTTPLAAALILIAAPAVASVKKGIERWEAGDHKGAVTEWLPLAARGDSDALFNLGQAYRLGRGVAKNEAVARDYYRKAATRGHVLAQESLGIALYRDPASRAEAVRWFEQAAKKGQPRSQYVLGVAHFNGSTAPKNWPLAYAYMLRAQNGGYVRAQAALDTMNANIPVNDRLKGEEIAVAMATGSYPAPIAAAQTAPAPAVAKLTPAGSLAVKTAVAAPGPAKAEVAVATSGWRVQLGAFSQRGMAVEAWTGLKTSQATLLAGVSPIYAPLGDMVRLQLGPFASREDARRLCGRLQAVGRGCFVVNG